MTAQPEPVKAALPADFPILAHRGGFGLVMALIIASGGACSQCGHGTRVTSKRWAKCKECGHRMERRKMSEVIIEKPQTK